ncbi:MAG: acyltransferase [Candidatus Accumulibacter sp.]|nr:acyltransferase [Accumulibacter sp.]
MLDLLPPPLIGVIAGLALLFNTLLWVPILLLLALVKLLLPVQAVRPRLDPLLVAVAESWIAGNSAWMRVVQRTDWDVDGLTDLDADSWYLVNCNHQSWVDILVLQYLLNRRIPLLKFFLKQQLLWVPVMGLAWWALDFPFMRRHSEEELIKRPELRRADQEATRIACEKFALIPTSVVNFCEGTRFTLLKHRHQQSPYRHLLRPKAGGIALALNVMGGKFRAILDVTLVYPDGVPTFWHFLCGRLRRVRVRVQALPVPRDLANGDYANDPAVRQAFRNWLEAIWRRKDQQIAALLGKR